MQAGAHVPDRWNCYPWDAAAYGRDIVAHEKLAKVCGGEEVAGGGEEEATKEAPGERFGSAGAWGRYLTRGASSEV